jgi:hypothetical protein
MPATIVRGSTRSVARSSRRSIVPVVVSAAEALEEGLRIERVAHLPQLRHHETAQQLGVERHRGEAVEVVEVAESLPPFVARSRLVGRGLELSAAAPHRRSS